MTHETIKISIAKDFSPVPAGRTRKDGPKSGEVFREDFLLPKLRQAEKEGGIVEISLDGVEGLGSSFLEETFGGLIRKRYYAKAQLKNLLKFAQHKDPAYPAYVQLIEGYMADASPE